jgi:hypothetical protein
MENRAFSGLGTIYVVVFPHTGSEVLIQNHTVANDEVWHDITGVSDEITAKSCE